MNPIELVKQQCGYRGSVYNDPDENNVGTMPKPFNNPIIIVFMKVLLLSFMKAFLLS